MGLFFVYLCYGVAWLLDKLGLFGHRTRQCGLR